MAGNRDLILAGVNGGGAGGTGLAWFGVTGTAAPTSAVSSLNAAFKDSGLITEDGLTRAVDEDSEDIPAFGLGAPARTLVTSSKITFGLAFLEHNPISLAVYHRLPLTAISPVADGSFDFTEGQHRTQTYSAVFDLVDGLNHVRAYVPSLEVSEREDFEISASSAVTLGVTCTAYPGSDGVAVHWFYKMNALAS